MAIKAVSHRHVSIQVIRLGLIALLVLVGVVIPAVGVAADPALPWRGEFYNNVNLTGAPALVRDDACVNFDWGYGSPDGAVSADHFSARWTTFLYFDAGDYTFHATSDDGVRLWVDEQLLIDQWHDHPVTTYSAVKYLGAGYHSLRIEYYENAGTGVCKVWWDGGGAPPVITEWRAEYYNNTWLSEVAVVRNESAVNYDWAYGSPATGINADNFSVRWTRDVSFATSGNHTFSATVDDGVRVWVDGVIVIDKWYPQSRTTHTGTIYLAAGTHHVKIEYFEATGVAVCMVSWTGGTVSPHEIIVDDLDSGFIFGGWTGTWKGRTTGYRNHLYWTWNTTNILHRWGKWYPYITTPGNWEVYVYIPNRYHGSKQAPYVIHHSGAQTTRIVNQNIYNNQWISLGTYYFSGGSNEYVYLGDNTGEAYATRFVGFDAMKFINRDTTPPPGPTPPPSGCAITPILGFGNVWNTHSQVRTKLGCPTEVEKGIWAGEETFVGGYMFWRQDQAYIYVLLNNGTWQGHADTWTSAEPEWDPLIVPPAGYYQPKRGFGKVWRDVPGLRTTLSWATTEERGFYGSAQAFDGGHMLWSNARGIYVLYNDGTWSHY